MVHDIAVLPNFEPDELTSPTIPAFQYQRGLKEEMDSGSIGPGEAMDMLEWMMSIRAFEEMILALRMQAFEPLRKLNFQYRGPTHLSVGQEATSVGACAALGLNDYITSTHRGHGDGIAKGYVAIRDRTDEQLRDWIGGEEARSLKGAALKDAAKLKHICRTAAELFGKSDGYCRGRGGGMHIADFSSGHLGANAIVGGSVPIATGAAYSARYLQDGKIALCFAGDGAYGNGVVLESLNMAAMAQFTNDLARQPFGVPVIFVIVNNQYGMTGQQCGEVSGVDVLARRALGFQTQGMHAEVVNGMDVLAVWDSIARAAELVRQGKGPVLRELMCYRYHGHSLSDPRNEYRAREEEAAWKAFDPIEALTQQILDAGVADEKEVKELSDTVRKRHEDAALLAAE